MRKTRSLKVKFNPARGIYEPVLLEEHVVTEIITRLWWNKIKVFRIRERIPGKGKLSTAGIPDLIGWIPENCGKFQDGYGTVTVPLFVECKRPGGVHRPAQTQFIDDAKSDGCVAFFAESWDDCVREFGAVGITLQGDK